MYDVYKISGMYKILLRATIIAYLLNWHIFIASQQNDWEFFLSISDKLFPKNVHDFVSISVKSCNSKKIIY